MKKPLIHPGCSADQPFRSAASYARKSDKNDEGLSAQHRINKTFAGSIGYLVADQHCFQDDDTSGITTHRSAWSRLTALVESGQAPFEAVIIRNSKRFGRWADPGMHDYLRIHFQKHGVRLLFVDDPNPDYSSGMTPELMVQSVVSRLNNISGSQELTETRNRVLTGIRSRICRGFFPGSNTPYGTERWLISTTTGQFIRRVPIGVSMRQINCAYKLRWAEEERLQAIRLMFEWVQERISFAEIAHRLNSRGAPTPDGHGGPQKRLVKGPRVWLPSGIEYILTNPIYKGDLLWPRGGSGAPPVSPDEANLDDETPILYKGFMQDPPISAETFDSVQQILSSKRGTARRARGKISYLLGGHILCAKCNTPWYGFTSTAEGVTRRRYYRHERKPKSLEGQRCDHRNRYVRASEVEMVVFDEAFSALSKQEFQAGVREELEARLHLLGATENISRGEALSAERDEIKRQMQSVILRQSLVTYARIAESFTAALTILSKQLDEVEKRLATWGQDRENVQLARGNLSGSIHAARTLTEVFQQASTSQKEAILSELIEKITYDPDTGELAIYVVLPSSTPPKR